MCWSSPIKAPAQRSTGTCSLGELSLDGSLIPVIGALPAAMAAAEEDRTLLCPKGSGAEAAWVGATQVIGAATLADVVRHYTGQSPLPPAEPEGDQWLERLLAEARRRFATDLLLVVGSPQAPLEYLASPPYPR